MVSFAGKTLSEQMWNKSTDKNYFFDVFNQYSISNTWEIKTTSPENKALDNGENIYSRWDDINPLYKKFLKDKKEIYSKKEENKSRFMLSNEEKNIILKVRDSLWNQLKNKYSWEEYYLNLTEIKGKLQDTIKKTTWEYFKSTIEFLVENL